MCCGPTHLCLPTVKAMEATLEFSVAVKALIALLELTSAMVLPDFSHPIQL